jgi:hypothetical protein
MSYVHIPEFSQPRTYTEGIAYISDLSHIPEIFYPPLLLCGLFYTPYRTYLNAIKLDNPDNTLCGTLGNKICSHHPF